jgi:hypothetical protein
VRRVVAKGAHPRGEAVQQLGLAALRRPFRVVAVRAVRRGSRRGGRREGEGTQAGRSREVGGASRLLLVPAPHMARRNSTYRTASSGPLAKLYDKGVYVAHTL